MLKKVCVLGFVFLLAIIAVNAYTQEDYNAVTGYITSMGEREAFIEFLNEANKSEIDLRNHRQLSSLIKTKADSFEVEVDEYSEFRVYDNVFSRFSWFFFNYVTGFVTKAIAGETTRLEKTAQPIGTNQPTQNANPTKSGTSNVAQNDDAIVVNVDVVDGSDGGNTRTSTKTVDADDSTGNDVDSADDTPKVIDTAPLDRLKEVTEEILEGDAEKKEVKVINRSLTEEVVEQDSVDSAPKEQEVEEPSVVMEEWGMAIGSQDPVVSIRRISESIQGMASKECQAVCTELCGQLDGCGGYCLGDDVDVPGKCGNPEEDIEGFGEGTAKAAEGIQKGLKWILGVE